MSATASGKTLSGQAHGAEPVVPESVNYESTAELRRQIQELQSQLDSKDDQIFELEATAATSKAESSHLTKKAEAAAQNRVHLVEEELRRSRTEALKFKNNWLKQRKRVLELEKNKQDVTNQNLDTNNSLPGRDEGKVSSWGIPPDVRVSPNLGASASKKNEPMLEEAGGGGEYEVGSSSNLSGIKRKTGQEPAFVEPTAFTACEKSRPLETIHQRTARHILSQIEVASYRLSNEFDIPKEDESEIGSAEEELKDENARLKRVLRHEQMKSLRSDVQRGGEIEQSVQSLLYLMSEAPSSSGSMSTSGLVYTLIQKLNSLFWSSSMDKYQTDDDGDQVMQSETDRLSLSLMVSSKALPMRQRRSESAYVSYSNISWRGALFIMHVMHDVLLLSGSARESLRWWLYHSHQSSEGVGSDCRQVEPPAQVESSRITGLPSGFLARRSRRDRNEVLWSSTCRSTHQTVGWDPTTMTQPCNTFFELLVSLMRGNFASLDDTLIVERALLRSLQLKSVELMMVLLRDAPPFDQTGANQGNGTPYLWKYIFESLITTDATSSNQIGDLFSVWEESDNSFDHILGNGRKHGTRLLSEATNNKDPSEKQHSCSRGIKLSHQSNDSSEPIKNVVNQNQSERIVLEVKTRVIELLGHFIERSSSVQQRVYEVVDGERSPHVSKRLLAAVLDDFDERIIPLLSSECTTSDCIDVERHLYLCTSCIDFILVLLDSDEGTRLVRMQMRLETTDDDWSQWSQSSIGCMTRLLNQALIYGECLVGSHSTVDPGILSQMNAIVDKSVRFFNAMLSIVHKKQRGSSRVSSFLALISENRDLFVSCCHRIAAAAGTADTFLEVGVTMKYDVSVFLDEVEADLSEEGK